MSGDESSDTDDQPRVTNGCGEPERASEPDGERAPESGTGTGTGDEGGPDPFERLDDSVEAEHDPFERLAESDLPGPRAPTSGDVVFERVDPDSLTGTTTGHPAAETSPEPPRDSSTEVVVPKRTHCESCAYFADPPEFACTHDGTEILELVDVEHFRVVNCPVVALRERVDGIAGPGETSGDDTGDGPTGD